jgi:hypothetical protein
MIPVGHGTIEGGLVPYARMKPTARQDKFWGPLGDEWSLLLEPYSSKEGGLWLLKRCPKGKFPSPACKLRERVREQDGVSVLVGSEGLGWLVALVTPPSLVNSWPLTLYWSALPPRCR